MAEKELYLSMIWISVEAINLWVARCSILNFLLLLFSTNDLLLLIKDNASLYFADTLQSLLYKLYFINILSL